MTLDGICAGHMQSWVTQPYTWPAPQLHAATAASLAHGGVVITCDGTHHYPCDYDNMRGIAETAGAWSGLLRLMMCPTRSDVLRLMMCPHERCGRWTRKHDVQANAKAN